MYYVCRQFELVAEIIIEMDLNPIRLQSHIWFFNLTGSYPELWAVRGNPLHGCNAGIIMTVCGLWPQWSWSLELLPSSSASYRYMQAQGCSTVWVYRTLIMSSRPVHVQCGSVELLPLSLRYMQAQGCSTVWFYCTFTIVFEVHASTGLFHSVILLHFYHCLWGTCKHKVVPQCDSVELLPLSLRYMQAQGCSTVWFCWTFTIVFEVHASTRLFHSVILLNFYHHCLLFLVHASTRLFHNVILLNFYRHRLLF